MSERKTYINQTIKELEQQFDFVLHQMNLVIDSCEGKAGIKQMADMERYSITMKNLSSTLSYWKEV